MFTCTDDAAAPSPSLIHYAELPEDSSPRLNLDAAMRSSAMSPGAGPCTDHVHSDVCILVASSVVARLGQRTPQAHSTDRAHATSLRDK